MEEAACSTTKKQLVEELGALLAECKPKSETQPERKPLQIDIYGQQDIQQCADIVSFVAQALNNWVDRDDTGMTIFKGGISGLVWILMAVEFNLRIGEERDE